MTDRRVSIVDTGVANIASLKAAFRRLDSEPELTRDPDDVRASDHLVLPGVGSFKSGMAMLREADLVEPVCARIEDTRPTLAVCMGMQVLAAASEEDPGVEGLGLVDVTVTRFPEQVRTPQFGWNRVTATSDCALLTDGYAYFANSFRIAETPEDWSVAHTDHGGPFVAAMEHGAVLACQFHPEISGEWGHRLLERWLQTREATSC